MEENNNLSNSQPNPQFSNTVNNSYVPPVSVGEWIVMMLVMIIPCVNIIMYCVWAFGSSTNPSKQNYCRAGLIMMAVAIVLSIFFSLTLGIGIAEALSSL